LLSRGLWRFIHAAEAFRDPAPGSPFTSASQQRSFFSSPLCAFAPPRELLPFR